MKNELSQIVQAISGKPLNQRTYIEEVSNNPYTQKEYKVLDVCIFVYVPVILY